MGKAGRPEKEGPKNAVRLLAFVRVHKCVTGTRAALADAVGLTLKQLRRATERLVAEKAISTSTSGQRFGGRRRVVSLAGVDPKVNPPLLLRREGED